MSEAPVVLVRIATAGALVGLERTFHGRPAGFRTHSLVCLASALLISTVRRGQEIGDSRVVLGVHYPRDVEAGRFAAIAIAIATGLLPSSALLKDFAEAKSELRAVLGL
jgi:uncharacterized membrane protein YhiD involved in acid resistance